MVIVYELFCTNFGSKTCSGSEVANYFMNNFAIIFFNTYFMEIFGC